MYVPFFQAASVLPCSRGLVGFFFLNGLFMGLNLSRLVWFSPAFVGLLTLWSLTKMASSSVAVSMLIACYMALQLFNSLAFLSKHDGKIKAICTCTSVLSLRQ